MKYQVNITERALTDMEAVYDYIAGELKEPSAAMRQYDRIAAAIESLSVCPNRCSVLKTEPERSYNMRQLLVDRYSVIYVVDAEDVTVLRVLYSASDIHNRLQES